MSSPYPILDSRPIDKWRVTELREELKRRKLTTKGLKEDLLKRLDEAIRTEPVPEDGDNNSDVPQSEDGDNNSDVPQSEDGDNNSDVPQSELQSDQGMEGSEIANHAEPKIPFEEGRNKPFVSRTDEASITVEKMDKSVPEDIDGSRGSEDEGEVAFSEVVNGVNSAPMVGASVAPVILSNGQHGENHSESGDLKLRLDKDDLSVKSPHTDNDLIITSAPSIQVSEVSPALELQVKSDSLSNDSISINEKIELKDNIIAEDIKLEVDVKPEIMQPSTSPIVLDDDKSHPMDVAEPHENKSFVEETGGENTENVEVFKKSDSGDVSSPEKLNLDQSSGDDFMEEDVVESKQIGSKPNSDEMGDKVEKVEVSRVNEEGLVDVVGDGIPADTEVGIAENEKCDAESAKRKLNDESAVGINDVKKRQRRWNTEAVKLPGTENANTVDSTTPKDTFHPTFKRSFSKSASTTSEEAPKERVVPPSSKPPTDSLRIDRFLRPFTLKAVQELLGKTGSVTGFWMDHIKTHCYVSYSSVEEAIGTRNAVYNLQWPTNGGHLLIAEFVDPQDVKARINSPSQSPAMPVSRGPSFPPPATRPPPQATRPPQPTRPPQATRQPPQPSTQQQVQKQQLPPPPPPPRIIPPLPPLSNSPPVAREEPPPQAREQPLPPPPIHEKVDPPIITLDDLFRKTKATPRIYYLPLSDEQVAGKLKARGKNIEQ